jgi:hypothetical protein
MIVHSGDKMEMLRTRANTVKGFFKSKPNTAGQTELTT